MVTRQYAVMPQWHSASHSIFAPSMRHPPTSFSLFSFKILTTNSASSQWTIPPTRPARTTLTTCVACTARFWTFDVAIAPCGHVYWRGCARFLFSIATRDESAFPPRCCGAQIPLTLVDHLIEKEEPGLVERFLERANE